MDGSTSMDKGRRGRFSEYAGHNAWVCLGQVSPAYRAIDTHTIKRLRQWLCRKHKVRSRKYVRYPDKCLWQDMRLTRLAEQMASFAWA